MHILNLWVTHILFISEYVWGNSMFKKRLIALMVLSVLLMALMAVPVSAQNNELDFRLDPTFGETTLRAGFTPDPFGVAMVSGGSVEVDYITGCRGHAATAPDFRIQWSGDTDLLRFFFAPDDNATGSVDTTMIINDPRGRWSCDDDSFSTLQPTIDFEDPIAGEYNVWVGSFREGNFVSGCLFITQSTRNDPSSTRLPECTAVQDNTQNTTGGSTGEGNLTDRLYELNEDDDEINFVSFAPDGGWVVVFNDNGFFSRGIPTDTSDALLELNEEDSDVVDIAFHEDGGWVIIYDSYGYWFDAIPRDLGDALIELNENENDINDVEIYGDDAWVIIFDGNGYWYDGIPRRMADRIVELNEDNEEITDVAIMEDGGWIIFYGTNGYYSVGMPEELVGVLEDENEAESEFNMVAFDEDDNWSFLFGRNGFWSLGTNY